MDSFRAWCLLFTDIARILLVINTVLVILLSFGRIPKEISALRGFLLIDAVTEWLAKWLAVLQVNNLPLLHLYTPLEFLTISWFFKVVFADWVLFQRYFYIWVVIVLAFLIGNSIFLEPLTGFNSNAKTLTQIIIITYATAYFFRSFGKIDFSEKSAFAIALVNVGILFYYSGSLFIFMFSKALNSPEFLANTNIQVFFWMLNGALFLLFQILIFIATWKVARIRIP